MKPLVIVPTYNEAENIKNLIDTIRAEDINPNPDILVVDSASPDNTAGVVKDIMKADPKVFLFEQKAKLGLGKAYLDGMGWCLERDYDILVTMDADFSHHPRYLHQFFQHIVNKDVVIGSRYMPGGELKNWPKNRQWLSKFANWYARSLMGMPFSDLTAGFHCFRIELLKKILRYKIHTEGYAFLMELKFLAILQEGRFGSIPIVFSDRTKGESKISKRVIFESMFFVWQRSLQRKRIKGAVKRIVERESLASSKNKVIF
jgi:dolichol-phosphate mannosyltransferase